MIVSFRHKGLRRLYETGAATGVRPDQVKRLNRILAILDAASEPDDFEPFPGLGLHALKGDYSGYWSVRVSGNWRVTFRFANGGTTDVDLVDYH